MQHQPPQNRLRSPRYDEGLQCKTRGRGSSRRRKNVACWDVASCLQKRAIDLVLLLTIAGVTAR